MFYAIYKITNQLDGKIYIGSHKTSNLDDGYMGSGKYLIHAQKKYGIENFKKEILFVFKTAEEMYAKEAEIVNEDFLATENTYNLKVGGFGGFDYINRTRDHSAHSLKNAKKRDYTDPKFKEKQAKAISIAKTGVPHPRYWKTLSSHKEETKRKISASMKGKQIGNKNSQYGTCWIKHDMFPSRKCSFDLYPLFYEQGWTRGR